MGAFQPAKKFLHFHCGIKLFTNYKKQKLKEQKPCTIAEHIRIIVILTGLWEAKMESSIINVVDKGLTQSSGMTQLMENTVSL